VRTTPVVIAHKLDWVTPQNAQAQARSFEDALNAWRNAKAGGDLPRMLSFYAPDFAGHGGRGLPEWSRTLRTEVERARGRDIQLKDVSYLRWTDSADTMVVTFGEVHEGARTGQTRRQYWLRQGDQWKIFYEGVIG